MRAGGHKHCCSRRESKAELVEVGKRRRSKAVFAENASQRLKSSSSVELRRDTQCALLSRDSGARGGGLRSSKERAPPCSWSDRCGQKSTRIGLVVGALSGAQWCSSGAAAPKAFMMVPNEEDGESETTASTRSSEQTGERRAKDRLQGHAAVSRLTRAERRQRFAVNRPSFDHHRSNLETILISALVHVCLTSV